MELLNYDFVQRGLITGIIVAVLCSVIGVFLVLRRMAFLGAGLSHSAFGGIAVGLFLKVDPFSFTVLFTLLIGNLIQFVTHYRKAPTDAVIAVVFSGGMSLAILILGFAKGFGEYIFSYLFGDILMVTETELRFTAIIAFLSGAFLVLFYKKLVLLSFSEEIAKLRGVNTTLVNHALVSLASVVIVLAIKVVGIVLASAMVVIPALTALLLGRSFLSTLVLSALVSVLSVVGGIVVAFHYNVPPGGSIVALMVAFFILSLAGKTLKL